MAGQLFSASASPNDLWSAGALPRYSDADGLTYHRFANAFDDSGYYLVAEWLLRPLRHARRLHRWDSNFADNFGSIRVTLEAMPVPGPPRLSYSNQKIVVPIWI